MADQEQMIDVFNANGERGQIPVSQATQAFRNGQFKFAQQDGQGNWQKVQPVAVSMKDANGNFSQGGFVPLPQAGRGLKDGVLKIGLPTAADKPDTETDPNLTRLMGNGMPTQQDMNPGSSDQQQGPSMLETTKKFLQEAGSGLRKMAFYKPSAGESAAHYEPLEATAGAMAQSGVQSYQQAKKGEYGRATVSGLSAVNPLAAPAVSQINQLEDTGQSKEAEQRALLNVLLLASGSKTLTKGIVAPSLTDAASGISGAATDTANLVKLRLAPESILSPDELLARKLNTANPITPGSGAKLLQLHTSTKIAVPLIQDAASSIGVPITNADDALAAINKAKDDVLTLNLGSGTLADVSPEQTANIHSQMDALNHVQSQIQSIQAADEAKAAARAAKGKPPIPTTSENLQSIGTGLGKTAAGQFAAKTVPFGGTVFRAGLRAAGVTSGFSDVSTGLKGLAGFAPSSIDSVLQKVFPAPDEVGISAQRAVEGANVPTGPDPFAQPGQTALTDTSVQHTSNIAPPLRASGDAQTFPDVPNGMQTVSSSSTSNPADLIQRLRAGAARQGQVQTSTAFPASVTPQLEPKQLNLAPTAQPGTMSIQDIQNAAREATARQAPGTVEVRNATPQQNAVDIKAAQTMNADYLGRHGSALDQARAEWQAQNPGQTPPAFDSGIMRRAGEIDAQMRQGANAPATPQTSDIFPNDKAMEDWLNQQEQSNPALQRIKDLAKQRIQQGDLPPGIRPSPSDLSHMERQVQSAVSEANAQGIDTPAYLDIADQWMRKTNVQPKSFQPGRPLKTSQPPLEGQSLIEGLMSMKARADAAKTSAQAAAPGTSTTIPAVQRSASLDSIREALSKPPDPTTASAAQLSALRNELVRATDPAQRADIQQAIDHLQAVQTGQPFSVIDQATKEGLPATQPRDVEPGSYVRETKQTIPADANIIRANSPTVPAQQLQMGDTAFVNPQDVKLDPSRFQFKHNVSERGVTNQFADVKKFDENLAGVIDAYKDPATGELYAVNGHHRTALAQDLNAPRMKVNVMDTQDATEARARGAAKNLAEGRGTGFDAAVFLRDSGLKASDLEGMGISLSDAKVNTALGLKNLSPEILDKVGNGTMDEGRGVAIGQATDNPDLQREILNMVQNKEKTGTKLANDVVASLAKHVVNSPNYETQTQSLFGPQAGTRSLAVEKAQVDAGIIRNLRGEKAAFGAVKSQARADQLGRAGNVIKPEENRAIADRATQSLELYNRLSQRAGPVNKAVETAAIEMSLGKGTKQAIIDNATQQIRQILDQEMSGGQAGQASGPNLETPR